MIRYAHIKETIKLQIFFLVSIAINNCKVINAFSLNGIGIQYVVKFSSDIKILGSTWYLIIYSTYPF